MTVSTTTARIDYAGNGTTTNFPVPFRFFASADLMVYSLVTATGVETLLTLGTDYTVTGAGDVSGGAVIMTTAPASGVTLSIQRETVPLQSTDYVDYDPFPAESHEAALDKLTLITQEVKAALDRVPRERRSEPTTGLDLPSRVDRASKILGWDGTGAIIAVPIPSTSGPVTTPYILTLLDDGDAATARATLGAVAASEVATSTWLQAGTDAVTRTIQDKLRDVIHPAEFNILPGNTDNQDGFAALAAEINARGGGIVIFPPNQTYNVFDDGFTAGVTILMELEDLKGVRIDMNGSKIRTTRNWVSDAATCRMFQFTDCEDVDLVFEAEQATGATTDTPTTGHIGAYFINKCRNIKVRGKMYGGRGGCEVVRGTGFSFANYAENFQITMETEHVFYPVAFERNGRSAEIDIVARYAGRSLYLGNASNVEARVWTNNTGLYDDIVITAVGAAGEGTINNACDNITLHVTHRPDTSAGTGVFSVVTLVMQQADIASPLNPCRLSNIDVTFDCDYTGAAAMPAVIVFAACQKDSSGTAATNATAHQATNLRVRGSVTGMTGSNPIIDWFRTGSPALVGSAICGGWHFGDITISGAGTPAFYIQRDVVDFDLTLRNIYAPGSTITWSGTLPAGILDASQGVNLSNLKSVGSGYRLLPQGRMRQWGVAASVGTATNVAVTLPQSFRSTPTGAIVQSQTSGVTDQINVAPTSASEITINRPGGAGAANVYWEVEGEL